MIKRFLFDASAVLAIIRNENIKIDINLYLENSVINAVNAGEVLTVLQSKSISKEIAEQILVTTITEIIPVSFQESCLAAEIKVQNKQYGISTGDSFCIASSLLLNYPIITADKIWADLNLDCQIILIR